jgi:hypothetical protein
MDGETRKQMNQESLMPGLLADVNVQGHLPYLKRIINGLGFLQILEDSKITFMTFRELNLNPRMNDRDLWNYCQANDLVLFTENRNQEHEDSLSATILDSWHEGQLPVLTLANKGKFENSATYATLVAENVTEMLYCIFCERKPGPPRIFVPF